MSCRTEGQIKQAFCALDKFNLSQNMEFFQILILISRTFQLKRCPQMLSQMSVIILKITDRQENFISFDSKAQLLSFSF